MNKLCFCANFCWYSQSLCSLPSLMMRRGKFTFIPPFWILIRKVRRVFNIINWTRGFLANWIIADCFAKIQWKKRASKSTNYSKQKTMHFVQSYRYLHKWNCRYFILIHVYKAIAFFFFSNENSIFQLRLELGQTSLFLVNNKVLIRNRIYSSKTDAKLFLGLHFVGIFTERRFPYASFK